MTTLLKFKVGDKVRYVRPTMQFKKGTGTIVQIWPKCEEYPYVVKIGGRTVYKGRHIVCAEKELTNAT